MAQVESANMADLSKILPVTLRFEGGFSNDAHDPGGATMEGITLATFRRYEPGASVAQLKSISDAEVLRIYRDGYFAPIGGDTLSQGVGMVAFDYAVNSGVGAGKKALARSSDLSGAARVRKISDGRLSFMHSLKTWRYFGAGWGRRVGSVEALAIKWESGPAAAPAEITKAAASARKRSEAMTTHAAIASTVAIPATAAPTKTSIGLSIGVGLAFLVVVVIVGVLAFHNSQRATALAASQGA